MLNLNTLMASVTYADVDDLVAQQEPEDDWLDYKAGLYGRSDSEKKDFAKDVAALANTRGGWIVLGVAVDAGNTHLPDRMSPFSVSNEDEEGRRLRQMARSSIDPPVDVEVRFVPDPVGSGEGVMVIRVPEGWGQPHMVRIGESRFWVRRERENYYLTREEIRRAFMEAETWIQKLRDYREARLEAIKMDEVPGVPLPVGHPHVAPDRRIDVSTGALVLHVAGAHGFDPSTTIDVVPHCRTNGPELIAGEVRGTLVSIDGFIAHSGVGSPRECTDSYTLVFRNGLIESVDCWSFKGPQWSPPSQMHIDYEVLMRRLDRCIPAHCDCLRELGFGGRFAIGVSLLFVEDWSFWYSDSRRGRFDRAEVRLPLLVFDQANGDYQQLRAELSDLLWQAAGKDRTPKEGDPL